MFNKLSYVLISFLGVSSLIVSVNVINTIFALTEVK